MDLNQSKEILVPLTNFRAGTVIEIEGRMVPGPSGGRFDINLQEGTNTDKCNVPFHMSARPNVEQFVRNCRFGGWLAKDEERSGGFPIVMEKPFQMKIGVDATGYNMWIDGKLFATMKHRLGLELVRFLNIKGSVEITYLKVSGACMKSV